MTKEKGHLFVKPKLTCSKSVVGYSTLKEKLQFCGRVSAKFACVTVFNSLAEIIGGLNATTGCTCSRAGLWVWSLEVLDWL
jgi:hypothetical protein